MKRNIFICAAASLIFLFSLNAYSEDSNFGGKISLKGKLVDVNGNEAKFNEYRDLDDGLYGHIKAGYDTEKYHFKFKAMDIGYDTQEYTLDGGMYGDFTYHFIYNEIPHNITYDARTFYSGAGGNDLTFSGTHIGTGQPITTDPGTWKNTFDYSIERKQFGGDLTFEMMKPFYLDISVSRERRDGILPVAAARAISSFGGMVELPAPVDYVTDVFKVEGGYAKNPVFASIAYFYSKFENENDNLNFRFPNTADSPPDTDAYTLPPGNKYYKLAFKGKVKLPFSSALSANAGRSRTTSQADVLRRYITATGSGASTPSAVTNITNISDTDFAGKVETTNYAFVLTSSPLSSLGGKIYYKYYKKDNESDQISGDVGGVTYTNHLFEYKKKMFGAEVDVKLPAKFTVIPHYKYAKIEREREDIPETKDNIYGIDAKWSGLDFMTVQAGYEKLDRRADADVAFGTGTTGPYSTAFDGAPQDRDTYKASLDIYPLENLNIGLEYRQSKSDYDDSKYGLLEEEVKAYIVNADYKVGTLMTLSGYIGLETYEHKQLSTRSGFGTLTAIEGWRVEQEDESRDYGISTEIYIIPEKLTVRAQYDDIHSDGEADLSYFAEAFPPGVYTNDSVDIDNWDDYRKQSVVIKAMYNFSANLAVTAGYAYEKLRYEDAQLDNYDYFPQDNSFLSGAYMDPEYNANVVFVGAAYKF